MIFCKFWKFCKTKLIICLSITTIIISYPMYTMAAQVSLQWDKNKEAYVTEYNLYCRKVDKDYNYDEPVWTGSENTCTVKNLEENTNYYFVVRAVTYAGNESHDSAEVEYDYERDYPSDENGLDVDGEHQGSNYSGTDGDGIGNDASSGCFIGTVIVADKKNDTPHIIFSPYYTRE